MTTIAESVEAVASWLEERVCPRIALKRPAPGRDFDTAPPEWATPAVYRMFLPPVTDPATSERRSLHPSITVMATCDERPAEASSRLAFTLAIGTWNPGTHAAESADPDAPALAGAGDGWRDGLDAAELVVREIRRSPVIGGVLAVDLSPGIQIGPWDENGALVDFYPYYYTKVAFSATAGTAPASFESDFL